MSGNSKAVVNSNNLQLEKLAIALFCCQLYHNERNKKVTNKNYTEHISYEVFRRCDYMKVKYIGERSSRLSLINGKIYECLGREYDSFRVIDETDEDYLYPVEDFEIVEE